MTNREDVDVVLTRIETIPEGLGEADSHHAPITLAPDKSYSFVSGLQTEMPADELINFNGWTILICE